MHHQPKNDLVPQLESHHTHGLCLVLALANILRLINAKKLVLAQGGHDRRPDLDRIHVLGQNPDEDLQWNQLKSDPARDLDHALRSGADNLHFARVSVVLAAHPPGHVIRHIEGQGLVPGLVAGIG